MTDTAAPLLRLSVGTVGLLEKVGLGVAALAVVVLAGGWRYGWLDYRPTGAAFETTTSPIFAVLFGVAAVVALRWEIAGGILGAFTATGLIAFASKQLVPAHAAFVVALLAVPAAIWLIVAAAELSRRSALAGIGAVAVMSVAGFVAGTAIYDNFWGPTHPSSTVAALPDSPVHWVWSGSVTTSGAEVRAHPRGDYESVRLALSTDAAPASPSWIEPVDESGRVVGFRMEGLDADTTYHYAVEIDGQLDDIRTGTFTTFPQGVSSFTIAVGACARNGSNGTVFDTIRELDPLLYLIVGDLHYGDTGENSIERYREVMDLTLSQPAQSALYRSTPIAYVWDDHDYGPNDADGNSPSRQAAMESFREHVPSYELAGPESAVYQAFTVGRVRFVMTDARSAQNLDVDEEFGTKSLLGAEQKGWFKSEVVDASRSHELVVWVNPVPWVSEARDGSDNWGGFPDERRELADHIAGNGIDNLLMVSGDAHMVAIDDGTNTDYTTNGSGGFPLLHSAALDRPGSVKGGPYSEGAIGDGGQFATIEFTDDGDAITVELTGRTWDGQELMSYEFSTAGTTGADR